MPGINVIVFSTQLHMPEIKTIQAQIFDKGFTKESIIVISIVVYICSRIHYCYHLRR